MFQIYFGSTPGRQINPVRGQQGEGQARRTIALELHSEGEGENDRQPERTGTQ
jgi:hypothetical protein